MLKIKNINQLINNKKNSISWEGCLIRKKKLIQVRKKWI